MLDPKKEKDQVDYSELLKPPHGYVIDRAIGTTYSLDLQALLAIPVAMYYSKPLEADFSKSDEPLDVFDAISRASKIVTIFYQKGKIKGLFNKLMSFTEDCTKEIIPDSAFSSFHPKCWWLCFHNPVNGEKMVRFAVLSRNLTFDRSWDVSFSFEGKVTTQVQSQNKPFIELLHYLEKASGFKIENKFKKEIEMTDFKTDLPVKSWNFFPIGISSDHLNPLLNSHFRPEILLMMSPFVDDKSVIDIAVKASKKAYLFSRKTELFHLKPSTFQYLQNSLCIPDKIVNSAWDEKVAEDLPNAEPELLDLHAKLYISKKGATYTWQLGSANLTQPAFGRNIECLIQLNTNDTRFAPDAIYKELVSTKEERKLFEDFDHSNNNGLGLNNVLNKMLRSLEFGIIKCPFTGQYITDESGHHYTYEMQFDAFRLKIEDDFKVCIQLFNSERNNDFGIPVNAGEINNLIFSNRQTESQLSKYFIFNILYKGNLVKNFIMKAEIEMPPTRHNKILAEIINSKEKFFQYLRFLLKDSGIVEEITTSNHTFGNQSVQHQDLFWYNYNIPLYEDLLRAAAEQPQKLRSIDDLMKRILANDETKSFISPELIQLWNVFKEVIK